MQRKLTSAELASRLGVWNAEREVLYRALAAALERLITTGQVAPGTVLPAERGLASELCVSRGTVMAAYESLRERGMVATVHGSGTVVLHEASPVSGPREAHLTTALPHDSLLVGHGRRSPDHIDLRSASWVGPDALTAITSQALHLRLVEAAGADRYDILGSVGLRNAVAGRLTSLGLASTPDEILITSGAQQAIALTAQLYLGPGDRAVAEDPTYPGAVEAMVAQQARVHRVPVGPAGVELTALAATVERHDPRLVYLVPSVHNPTGSVMPGAARSRLTELILQWNTTVVDDTTLHETQIDGRPPAPLAAYASDRAAQRIITVGSLSKSVWDGLRIGWVRASTTTIERLARLKSIADLGTPLFTQAVAEELLRDPADLFGRRRAQLAHRRKVMAELLTEHLPQWRWQLPHGGLCYWVDTGLADTSEFCRTAERHGVLLIPPLTSSSTERFRGHLRVPFAQPTGVLEEAVLRIRAAWRDHLASHAPLDAPQGADLSQAV